MADEEFSQIDGLAEQDVLEALGEKSPAEESTNENQEENDTKTSDNEDSILIEDYVDETAQSNKDSQNEETLQEEEPMNDEINEDEKTPQANLEVSSSEISTLLTELLKNKTLEITIKIKE